MKPEGPLYVLHSGEFAEECANMVLKGAKARGICEVQVVSMETFKKWAEGVGLVGQSGGVPVLVLFIVATIENEQPNEAAGACTRFFNRKAHPAGMLAGRLKYAVFGLGDSNLLLDRQTTTAKDCNQVAQRLDARLSALGGESFCPRGEADDRTGSTELEPWLETQWWPALEALFRC